MPVSLLKDQPPARDGEAPGLEVGEAALRIGEGKIVAAGVRSEWLANGAGVAFVAWARWITPDGSTKTDAGGRPIRTETSHSADMTQLAALGVDGVRRELLLAVLGEAPTLIDDDEGKPQPALPLAVHNRLNVSIRTQIALVLAADDPADPAALLGV